MSDLDKIIKMTKIVKITGKLKTANISLVKAAEMAKVNIFLTE